MQEPIDEVLEIAESGQEMRVYQFPAQECLLEPPPDNYLSHTQQKDETKEKRAKISQAKNVPNSSINSDVNKDLKTKNGAKKGPRGSQENGSTPNSDKKKISKPARLSSIPNDMKITSNPLCVS